MADDLASLLRALPSLIGTPPDDDDLDDLPEAPFGLLRAWLAEAVAAGVPEPHAAVLSTVDAAGSPDARVLLLKAVEDGRLGFAGGAESGKGVQIAVAPVAALTLWWQPLVRSVRVRGRVEEGTAEEHRADFLARGVEARIAALVGGDGPRPTRDAFAVEVSGARDRVEREPDLVDPRWRRWWLMPDAVEFWQGDPARLHDRVRYRRVDGAWSHEALRP